jgi:hypothetical protein
MKLISVSTILARFAISASVAIVFALLVPQDGLAQSDPMVGTWKLNLAKSNYKPGPPPRNINIKVDPAGQGLMAMLDGTNAQGMPIHQMITIICDGQPHPITGAAAADASSCRRPDPYTQSYTNMKEGRTTTNGTVVVSRDGRVMTITTKGVNANGQQIDNVAVYDKQ